MKIKQGDKVVVIAGKDKGKKGDVRRTYSKMDKVIVEGINMHTKFIKKGAGRPGQQVKIESPIHVSNVMLLDPTNNKPTRVGYKKNEGGSKYRVSKKSGEAVDKAISKSDKKKTTK